MEFILINDMKLKIMLSRSDLEEFDVRANELDYSNTETKRMFWDIIERAKKNVGFCCDGMRVLVQLYASRDGGCEMFVSKLGNAYNDPLFPEDSESSSLHCQPLYKRDKKYTKKGVFCFDRLEWLITVCRRLFDIGYSGESSAYIDDERSFYLFLDGLDATGYLPIDEYSFISEYGSAVNTEATAELLCERGKQICAEQAVQILAKL